MILDTLIQAKKDQAIGKGDWYILVDNRRKRRRKDLSKPERKKKRRREKDLKTYDQKGDDSRVPVEMWDRRAWEYEGERESGALNVLCESMLIWWRRKLTREFYQVLRRILVTWKRVGSSQGFMEVVGEYVWIEGAQDSYLQERREILKNKDWEAGVDCL